MAKRIGSPYRRGSSTISSRSKLRLPRATRTTGPSEMRKPEAVADLDAAALVLLSAMAKSRLQVDRNRRDASEILHVSLKLHHWARPAKVPPWAMVGET